MNTKAHFNKGLLLAAMLLALAFSLSTAKAANAYFQTNLVSDIPGLASITDPNLINPWGISFSSTSPFWVSDNGTGVATLYNGAGRPVARLVVTIPGCGQPTGQVFNRSAAAFNGDLFLFASEDGTISGWRGALGTNAEILQLADPANVYKGLAFGNHRRT